jgi:hypothetical protein
MTVIRNTNYKSMWDKEYNQRPSSCNLNPFDPVGTKDRASCDDVKSKGLEHVPQEKIVAMQVYAKELRRKFPHMKPARLQRKVAEYFKIKLT